MCGIAGKVYLHSGTVTEKDLLKMTAAIAHRGPDDEGVWISSDKTVGLGNRRLAVVDLSKKGHMPMQYQKRYWITYNGEIYNFLTERKKLQRAGYRFLSKTDTEVIAALYAKYGKKCVHHLRGMFSFAIYDQEKQQLFFAVGKLGKKPLKYYWDGSRFIFASELKAILTQKEVAAQIDLEAIHHYLTYGYVFAPRTGFQNIYKLRPGHTMTLDLKTKQLHIERYWQLNMNNKLQLSEEEWVENILEKLRESVKLRMLADVPVGAFLSGGIDSSMVVALMAQESNKPINTFTIGFKEKNMDETAHARRVADLYQTNHHELVVEQSSVDLLPYLAKQYEEPFFDASSVVTYLVSKMARKHVTVALNGDGGDENFAGYDRYMRLRRDSFIDHYRGLLFQIEPLVHSFHNHYAARGSAFLKKLHSPISERFVTYNALFLNHEKEALYTDAFKQTMKSIDSYDVMTNLFDESGAHDMRDRGLYADINMYLPEDLLVKVDIASMAVSLEGRSPFLDSEFVEMAAQIPFGLKVKGKEYKYILKKAAEKLIPKENIYRPKMGFSIPLREWFSESLSDYAIDTLLSTDAKIAFFIKQEEIKKMLNLHGKQGDYGPKIWALLTLELWLQAYFK